MADLGQTEIAAAEPPPAPPKISATRNPILDDPITPTLLRLALPNVVAMAASISVLIAETTYIGILGIAPLAAIALMFPLDHPDDDDVRRRHGRRHRVCDCARARRRRQAARSDAGDPCLRDRHRHRRDRSARCC